jgi:2-polyprenyl-3-methyl-5-hydroxy-6-metoxy-1,4-benzoquinol methylase
MNKSEKFWNKVANRFDQAEKKDEQISNRIIEKTKKYLGTSNIVLDFGCGTGTISNEIAGHVKMIHAIDISSKMIEIARKKTNGRHIENIEYVHSTIFDEKYKRSSFDVILGFYILHLLENIPEAMHRINELLKPGGLIISATPCLGEKMNFLSILLFLESKIGFIPNIKLFKASELKASFANENFGIIETEYLHQRGQQYFIAAKKL